MRKVLFTKPRGMTQGSRHFYRALINGEWVDGTYAELSKKHDEAKKEHLKQKYKAKKV